MVNVRSVFFRFFLWLFGRRLESIEEVPPVVADGSPSEDDAALDAAWEAHGGDFGDAEDSTDALWFAWEGSKGRQAGTFRDVQESIGAVGVYRVLVDGTLRRVLEFRSEEEVRRMAGAYLRSSAANYCLGAEPSTAPFDVVVLVS